MTLKEILQDAAKNGYALAAFNAPSFDAMRAISAASADLQKPVIIQTSAKLVKQNGANTLAAWFATAKQTTGGKAFLHLDHCRDISLISECIDAGWDMVMFDGSHLPLRDNIANAKIVCELAHAKGVSVEGEVGCIGGEEDGIDSDANYASDEEIERLSNETGIDCIAVGFGNVHGDYETKSSLSWDIYERAAKLSRLPLVLHGGSGLTDAEFARAISAGSAKVNISTELKKAYAASVRDEKVLSQILASPGVLHDTLHSRCHDIACNYINKFAAT